METEDNRPRSEGYAIITHNEDGSLEVILDKDPRFASWGGALAVNAAIDYTTYMERLRGSPSLRNVVGKSVTNRSDVAKQCYENYKYSSIVSVGLKRKAEFGSAGFQLWCENEKQLDWVNDLAYHLNLDMFDLRHHLHLQIVDMGVIWWAYYSGKDTRAFGAPAGDKVPKWIEFMPPWYLEPAGGGEIAFYPARNPDIKAYVDRKAMKISGAGDELKDRRISLLPPKVLDAAKKGTFVLLSDLADDGIDYMPSYGWEKIDWESFPYPSMFQLFADIEHVEICAQIDFNVIAQTKAGIIKYSMGPDATHIDFDKSPPPSEKQLKELEKAVIKNITNPLPFFVTGNDIKIEWVTPPDALYTTEKYHAASGRIFDWVGLPLVFWPVGYLGNRTDLSYASSYMSIKSFQQHTKSRRQVTKRWMERFLRKLCVINSIGQEKLHVGYDANVMEEDKVILQKTMGAVTQGLISNKTANDRLGFDYDFEMAQKKKEMELRESGILNPHYERGKGGGGVGQGRPSTEGVIRPTDQPKPNEDDMTEEELAAAGLDLLNDGALWGELENGDAS